MHVTKPAFKWEWNLNTIASLVGFALMLVAWGMNYQELRSGRDADAASIQRIEGRISDLEAVKRSLDIHDMRLTTLEARAQDSTQSLRAVEASISALSSDLRLTREILERLERSINGRTSAAIAAPRQDGE